MRPLSCLILAGSLATATASAAAPADALASFLDDRAAAVVRVRLDVVDVGGLVRDLGLAPDHATRLGPWVESLRQAGAKELYVVATLDHFQARTRVLPPAIVPLAEGTDAKAIGATLCGGPAAGGPEGWSTCASIRGAVLAGSDADLERARNLKPIPRPDLAAALEACGDAAIAAAFAPPDDLRRVVAELAPTLPAEVGGGSSAVLSDGLRWGAVSLTVDGAKLRLDVQGADDASARSLLALGGKCAQFMRASPSVAQFVPDFGMLVDALKPKADAGRISVVLGGDEWARWKRAVVDPSLESTALRECVNNLKILGLAMHNYHSEHDAFPPAYRADAQGKPLLSWRVLVLPYLEQQALYKEFHLDEPWDSPHNRPLADRMPEVFACPSKWGGGPKPNQTVYKTPRGPKTAFPGATGMPIKAATDGTSNTIMILETPADQAVVWTRPDDWDVPTQLDPKALFARHPGGSEVSFMDGSVRFLKGTIKPATLHLLLTPAGGEPVNVDEF